MENLERCRIPERILNDLYRQCQARLPYESCGALTGVRKAGELWVDGFRLLRNIAAEPQVSFRFEPSEWLAFCIQAQKNQREVVGLWHSHPRGPALPSAQDAEGWDGCGTYWIIGLEGDHREARVYSRRGAEWNPVPLVAV
ncbi:Mov34/MPN/PAD-1 family protein [Cohnella sp. AR92]|uniref:Mov34/MPN/PAD-1 family protein n=1 Tax=Cohnella sp. AR92 TaxID=648716 RepID=UPI000F8CA75A|nr:M67 family metallopeptidase [Cohnella sp. AR92]RUS47738.1 M67 family peptidase [Cohnella sp. AR92]